MAALNDQSRSKGSNGGAWTNFHRNLKLYFWERRKQRKQGIDKRLKKNEMAERRRHHKRHKGYHCEGSHHSRNVDYGSLIDKGSHSRLHDEGSL